VNVLKKKTKCYIYTRVSTVIQVDGYSLDAQKDKLKKYAEFLDLMLQDLESELIH
jgi:site-specific DNA recombinase